MIKNVKRHLTKLDLLQLCFNSTPYTVSIFHKISFTSEQYYTAQSLASHVYKGVLFGYFITRKVHKGTILITIYLFLYLGRGQ